MPQLTFKSAWPQALACLSTISIYMIIGLVHAYSAVIITQLEEKYSEFPVTLGQTSLIAILPMLLIPICAPLNGFIVDLYGRLSPIRFAVIPNTIGWICIATAHSIPAIYVGRILTGLTLSMGPGAAMVYTTEVARPDLRGILLSLGPVLITSGTIFIYVTGSFLRWRTIAWFNVGYGFLPLVLTALYSPESPVYLVSKAKNEEALKALLYLSRMGEHTGTPEEQLATIVREQKEQLAVKSAFSRLLPGMTKPAVYKPFILLSLLFVLQQCTGIYVTIVYAISFFQDFRRALDPNLSAVLVASLRLIVGLLTSYSRSKFGCRTLCIFSGLGMAIASFVSGYFTRLMKIHEASDAWMLWVSTVAIFLYAIIGVILMNIPWTLSAELFPLEFRGLCQGLIVATANILMICTLHTYRYLDIFLGEVYAVHWLFATFSLLCAIFVWLFLPETRNKKLWEIEDYFENQNSIIYPLHKSQHRSEVLFT